MRLEVVVGAQFGSEAKGHVASQLYRRDPGEWSVVVRVAGPNAGHTVIDEAGRKWPFRQLPVSVVHHRKNSIHAIAAGSEIDPVVLLDEIDRVAKAFTDMPMGSIIVDPQATVLEPKHVATETGMHERIGSTGKGIGAARADRIMRTARIVAQDKWLIDELQERGVTIGEVADTINNFATHVVIEGTQGYGLGLHAGYYPQCTSSDCRAIDFLGMSGVNPWDLNVDEFDVWAVARCFPIRVAGNSGPLASETTWEALGLPEEKTTVTQKVRRVGLWDRELVRRAVAANGSGPTVKLALTMADQRWPELWQATERAAVMNSGAWEWMISEGHEVGARFGMVTTSPETAVFL